MSSLMLSFETNDGIVLKYSDTCSGDRYKWNKDPLILLHGFAGSSTVWQRNIAALSRRWRVISLDLRGHGESDKPRHGYHVSRLAMDLRELVVHLLRDCDKSPDQIRFRAIGGSLGCSILWCYAELFTTAPFTHMIFVDQAPLQNSDIDWDSRFCSRGMNAASTLSELQATLRLVPESAYRGTISSCLSYRSHPRPSDNVSTSAAASDEAFFLATALKGNPIWYGKLMADHTALDWRDSIRGTFGHPDNETKVLVIASSRSGCFPPEGPLAVVDLINAGHDTNHAKGVVIDWGGHWCYWEKAEMFNHLALAFLDE